MTFSIIHVVIERWRVGRRDGRAFPSLRRVALHTAARLLHVSFPSSSPPHRSLPAGSWCQRSGRGSSRCCGSSGRTGLRSRRPTAREPLGRGRRRTTTTSSSTPPLPLPPAQTPAIGPHSPAQMATTSSSSAEIR